MVVLTPAGFISGKPWFSKWCVVRTWNHAWYGHTDRYPVSSVHTDRYPVSVHTQMECCWTCIPHPGSITCLFYSCFLYHIVSEQRLVCVICMCRFNIILLFDQIRKHWLYKMIYLWLYKVTSLYDCTKCFHNIFKKYVWYSVSNHMHYSLIWHFGCPGNS